MQYSECTKSCSTTCHSLNIQEVCKEECVDGCTCPGKPSTTIFNCSLSHSAAGFNIACMWVSVGKVLDGNRCVEVSQCSCAHMGRHFPPGSTISQDCNTWYEGKIHTQICLSTFTVMHLNASCLQCVPPWILGMYQRRLPWLDRCPIIITHSTYNLCLGLLIIGIISLMSVCR